MAWEAPNNFATVQRLAEQYPNLIRYHDLDFCIMVVKELNKKEPGKWGLNGKRGNPNDVSRDVIAYKNPEVPWGCSIVDIIGGHDNNSGAAVSPAWIDQTRATYEHGTVGYFIEVEGGTNPNPEPEPEPEPNPPVPPAAVCRYRQEDIQEIKQISQQAVDDVRGLSDAVHRMFEEVNKRIAVSHDVEANLLTEILNKVNQIKPCALNRLGRNVGLADIQNALSDENGDE